MRHVRCSIVLLALCAVTAHGGEAAFVKTDLSAAREEPDGETIAEARKGDGYAVLRTQGEWVQVQFTADPAWLPLAEVEVKQDVALKRVRTPEALVRAGPAPRSAVLGRLKRGTLVVERGGTGALRQIAFGGKKGWIAGDGLESERGARPTSTPTADSRARAAGDASDGDARGAPGSSPPTSGASSPGSSSPDASSAGASSPAASSPASSSPGSSSPGSVPASAPRDAAQPPPDAGRVPANVSQADLEVLARIIKGEALSCSHEGKVAVAAVVLNRVRAPGFPDTIRGVAHQPYQFSCYNPNVRNRLYFGEVPQSCWAAAREALTGRDPSLGATYYFNPYLVRPAWARGMVRTVRIGTGRHDTHDFYRPRR